jgi:uncharacterized membrane protein
MEESFRIVASYVALMLESLVVLTVAAGAIEAVFSILKATVVERSTNWHRRAVWLRFAVWILLSLEFALGADIVRTAIAPTWEDIGKLGVIALIRTGLGFFLGKDLETVETETQPEPAETAGDAR